jgi:hypothetical protein
MRRRNQCRRRLLKFVAQQIRTDNMYRLIGKFIPAALVTVAFLGCSKNPSSEQKTATPETGPKAAHVDGREVARKYVQGFIDRLLGGDKSVQDGLLGIPGARFVGGKIETVAITTVTESYLPDGTRVPDLYKVGVKATGSEFNGHPTTATREIEFEVKDGKVRNFAGPLPPANY